jgi:hypothetical protein
MPPETQKAQFDIRRTGLLCLSDPARVRTCFVSSLLSVIYEGVFMGFRTFLAAYFLTAC